MSSRFGMKSAARWLARHLCCGQAPRRLRRTCGNFRRSSSRPRTSTPIPTRRGVLGGVEGPGFSKRIYGFWTAARPFVYDSWPPRRASGRGRASRNRRSGLGGKTGSLSVVDWTEAEKQQNANRRGFLRPTPNGHALQHADGTPFFMVGDTWLGAATWRLPFTGQAADPNYELARELRGKRPSPTGSGKVITREHDCRLPTWASDHYANTYQDKKGIFYRNAWEKFGVTVDGKRPRPRTCTTSGDTGRSRSCPTEGLPNFDRIVRPTGRVSTRRCGI